MHGMYDFSVFGYLWDIHVRRETYYSQMQRALRIKLEDYQPSIAEYMQIALRATSVTSLQIVFPLILSPYHDPARRLLRALALLPRLLHLSLVIELWPVRPALVDFWPPGLLTVEIRSIHPRDVTMNSPIVQSTRFPSLRNLVLVLDMEPLETVTLPLSSNVFPELARLHLGGVALDPISEVVFEQWLVS